MNPPNLTPTLTLTPNTPYKILRVYLKGASVEVPHMADLPRQAISPDIGVDMQTEAAPAWPGALECVLRISLHARLKGKTVFLIEVSEAAVFELDLTNMEDAHRFVRQVAPSVLFPFARKDLASLAIEAGFQPVLLDHVDFDVMLTHVIKSQRQTRAPAPMRVDVIAAKPAMPAMPAAPSPAQEGNTPEDHAADWQETTPSSLSPAAQLGTAPGKKSSKPGKRLRVIAPVLLGMALLAAVLAWWLEPQAVKPTVAAVPERKAVTPPASPAPALPPVIVVPQETQAAIETSRARLADQPAAWFTLDMGSVPISTPLASLKTLPPDRPLFVLAAKADTLRVLYGVFASQAAAELVRNELQRSESMQAQQAATVVTIGSL